MTDKELFNAVNEIDERYITAAWNNTDLTSDTVIIRESGKASKLRVIALAAACVGAVCAAALAVYVRVGQRNVLTPSTIGSKPNGKPPSYVSIDTGDFFPRGTGPLPITLYGPDLIPISKADVAYVGLPDSDCIGSADFDGGDWEEIYCDNFTYLAPPAGLGTNSADNPELYADYSLPEAGFDIGEFDNSDYKRYNVGDKYGTLTLAGAGCRFKNQGSSPEECFRSCSAGFEGSVTLNAYLLHCSTANISIISGGLICVPKARELDLPVMSPYAKDGGFVSKAYIGGTLSGDFVYKSEYPPIYLLNANKFDLDSLFDADKDYVEVMITLSDISMEWTEGVGLADRINADIVSVAKPEEMLPIELYGPDYTPITQGDVTGVTLPDGKAVTVDKLDPDNWASVVCDGFTYIAPPSERNTEIVINSEFRPDNSAPGNTFNSSSGSSEYRRFNVGDKYGALTLSSAMTIFRNFGSSPGELLSECIAEFDGSVTLDAYVIRGEPNTVSQGAMICVPKIRDGALPVMFPLYKDGKFTSKSYNAEYLSGEFKYTGEYPVIYIQNANSYDLTTLFERGKDIAEVTVTLSNIHMEWYALGTLSDFILADIDEIRPKTVVTQIDDPLPFELYGPDYVQISFDDADDILDEYMNVIPREELTAASWDQIWCDGVCYLSDPAGYNYNSVDDAECFKGDGTFKNIYFGMFPRYDYRRFGVGDSFDGLRIESAMTVFSRTDEHAPGLSGGKELAAAEKLYMSNVSFSGETELNAYLVVSGQTLYCVPLRGETGLPVMFPISVQSGNSYASGHIETALAPAGGSFYYLSELPKIYLQNDSELDLTEYLGGRGYAKVTLTLDNISMSYTRNMSGITANIKSIRGFSD